MDIEDHAFDMGKEAVGNWQREDFGWHDAPENPEEFAVVHTNSRDSGNLERSNAAIIEEEMNKFLGDDCRSARFNHWAFGWVDGYIIRVFRDDKPTPAWVKWCEFVLATKDYPVLSDEDYSRREYESSIGNIQWIAKGLRDDVPEDWAEQVWRWFWDNNQQALDNHDNHGAYPSDDEVDEALIALDYKEIDDE